ncbi:LOB domain-containing protein 32 [Raphanus sativus]|uniref:LOB domain-containing protein 32-like n=1 Tax=Raphanus sativus TaxID=3726 RepID=A0A6J0N3E1_RAPSA|nr:LOB domain-containing protein 32-like [Raphanus sativus]KAJ4899733.1 LOB domain-containing protein 32 [Raphanus sativus]
MDLAICAACKFTSNGPCTLGNGDACIMAPFFPSTEPDKFDRVNKVFGVVNVYKILSILEEPLQREYAVNALCYEAEARIQDPIHGNYDLKLAYDNILNKFKRDIDSAINELEIPTDKKNQLKRLVDARRNAIIGMRENEQGGVHRADGASTSSGPANQNQP